MTDDLTSRRARAATLTATSAVSNTRESTEQWLRDIGTPMTDVWFLMPDQTWFMEPHVNDDLTLDETIGMAFGRLRSRYALRPSAPQWALHGPLVNKVRWYDTREAAEMVALHNG